MTYLASRDFFTEVAIGNIPGASIFIMEGETLTVKDADRAAVYLGSGTSLPTPSSAETMDIVSDNANDNPAGSGMKTITVIGLDGSGSIVSDTISMDGTTPVTTTQSFKRVFSLEAATVGVTGIVNGRVTCSGNTSSDEYAVLEGINRAGTGMFTVPTGKEAVLGPFAVILSPGGKEAFVRTEFQTRSPVAEAPWIIRMRTCQISSMDNYTAQDNTYPQVYPAGTDFRFVYSSTDVDNTIRAKLHIILRDP